MAALIRSWETWTDAGRSRKTKTNVEDREGPLGDSEEGRQNGNHPHVLRGAEETQLSTAGKTRWVRHALRCDLEQWG